MADRDEARVLDLVTPGRARLIGIAGAGMRSLAHLLAERGWRVEGEDRDRLAADDVIRDLPQPALDPAGDHLAIASPAVPSESEALKTARADGFRVLTLVDAVASLTAESGRLPVIVAGTHGKSTTAALLTEMLAAGGAYPTAWFGAKVRTPSGARAGGRAGSGREIVVEGCEYQRHFLRYRVAAGVITSVEPDHFDCYGSEAELCDAFAAFAAGIEPDGVLIVNGDDPRAVAVSRHARCRVATVDLADAPPSRLPGRHNAANVAIAAAAARELGVGPEAIARAAIGFRGLLRRFEPRGEWRGRVLVDDYAHHPTAIAATLATAREVFPGRRLVAVFEPHQVSRVTALPEAHSDALALADAVVLSDPFGARETVTDTGAVDRLAAELRRLGRPTWRTPRPGDAVDRVVDAIDDASRPGDVVVTMGAGQIEQVPDALSR